MKQHFHKLFYNNFDLGLVPPWLLHKLKTTASSLYLFYISLSITFFLPEKFPYGHRRVFQNRSVNVAVHHPKPTVSRLCLSPYLTDFAPWLDVALNKRVVAQRSQAPSHTVHELNHQRTWLIICGCRQEIVLSYRLICMSVLTASNQPNWPSSYEILPAWSIKSIWLLVSMTVKGRLTMIKDMEYNTAWRKSNSLSYLIS